MTRLALVAALALAAGSAQAATSPMAQNPPTLTTICVDVSGSIVPAVCKRPGSRLDQREDICICPAGGMRTEAPVCAPGERAPAETRAFERARRTAAMTGTLVGATYGGQRMCVAPRG